jgi:hypothetical protein
LPDIPSVSEPPAIHVRQQRPGVSPPGPWSGEVGSASGPGPVSTAACPQIFGPGLHTPGPGPLTLFGRQGYSPGPGPSQPVRRRDSGRGSTVGPTPGPKDSDRARAGPAAAAGQDSDQTSEPKRPPRAPSGPLPNTKSGVTGDVVTLRFMLHEHGDSRLPAAHPGLVPPLRTLLVGVNYVGSASNFSTLLADSILSGSPFLSAFLANTPDPTHSFLLSTLTLPGKAYVLLLAFSVRTRRAGPSSLRSGPQARGAAAGGRACGPRPAPRGPGPGLSTSWRAGPRKFRTQSRSLRRLGCTCWSRLDASHDPSAGGPAWPAGPLRRPPARIT